MDGSKKEYNVNKIHELMIKNRILPRELSIGYYLRDFMDKNKLNMSSYENIDKEFELKNLRFNNRKILKILFPDSEERRKEIYCEAINTAEFFIELEKDEDCSECKYECIIKDPEYIYYKSGLNIKNEDLEVDLISDILKKKYKDKFIPYYGLCLAIAINKLIRRNLLMVKKFIEEELIIFKEPEIILLFIDVLIKKSGNEFVSNKEEENLIEKYLELIPELSIT